MYCQNFKSFSGLKVVFMMASLTGCSQKQESVANATLSLTNKCFLVEGDSSPRCVEQSTSTKPLKDKETAKQIIIHYSYHVSGTGKPPVMNCTIKNGTQPSGTLIEKPAGDL